LPIALEFTLVYFRRLFPACVAKPGAVSIAFGNDFALPAGKSVTNCNLSGTSAVSGLRLLTKPNEPMQEKCLRAAALRSIAAVRCDVLSAWDSRLKREFDAAFRRRGTALTAPSVLK
jgi:hypothetical protein